MRRAPGLVIAALLISLSPACTVNLGNCDIDPLADCFNGKGNGGGSTGASAGTAGTGAVAGSGGAAGTGATSGSAGAAGSMPDLCSNGVKDGDERDVDCGGSCPNECGLGSLCFSGVDCASAFCFDGVCCDSECGGACFECNAPEHPGLCLPIEPGAQDGCPSQQACDFKGQCRLGARQVCAADNDCATGNCSLNTCVMCAMDGNCPSACIDGYCFDLLSPGQRCQAEAGGKNPCTSGFCVDGVCCESACTGLCMGCNASYTGQDNGTCAPILAGYDPHKECPDEPGGGYCSGADDGGSSNCAL